jgi:hypothetical protein
MKRVSTKDARMREVVTQEAAKIMAEEGVSDYLVAKRKAAQRLGAPDTRNLPTNREIQAALEDYQRLFVGEDQRHLVRRLRETALEAMEFFLRFEPRLVGSVLHGTATPHSDVNLHLFADAPEEVAIFLMDNQIPYELTERRFRFGPEQFETFPVYRFVAGEVAVDLTVFGRNGLRQAPMSRIDGQPMERANVGAVKALLL